MMIDDDDDNILIWWKVGTAYYGVLVQLAWESLLRTLHPRNVFFLLKTETDTSRESMGVVVSPSCWEKRFLKEESLYKRPSVTWAVSLTFPFSAVTLGKTPASLEPQYPHMYIGKSDLGPSF